MWRLNSLMKLTGHEKCRVSVLLSAKADDTKLKPMIAFNDGKRETEALSKEFSNQCVIVSSSNGLVNTDLTLKWISSVLGMFPFRRDTYECHITLIVQKLLKSKKIDVVLVPGGCTKCVQAPDVFCNKPFKAKCSEKYDEWLASEGILREAECGNLKPPPRKVIVQWILKSCAKLSSDMIRKLFLACGLSDAIDNSEDDEIHCFKEGETM